MYAIRSYYDGSLEFSGTQADRIDEAGVMPKRSSRMRENGAWGPSSAGRQGVV